MKTLQAIWDSMNKNGCGTDKGSVHSYIPVYEKLLQQYRQTALNVLEIGLFNGHSMIMWKSYFVNAKVYGIDCSETPHGGMADLRRMIKAGWDIHIFDAENKEDVAKRFSGVKFDVIIDDAGHHIEQQLNLFSIWKDYLVDDGLYIIEDIQDIDRDEHLFRELLPGKGMTIIDERQRKNRYDDVMIIIRNKYL